MSSSVKQMLEAANAVVPKITPAEAREMIGKGNTLVLDVRDAPEIEKSGKIAGALHVSRGMLEFRADPDSPYHDKHFAKDKTIILYCASGEVDVIAGYTSDGLIAKYDLVALEDNRHAIPPYDAILLLAPKRKDDQALQAALSPLVERIDIVTMREANLRAAGGDGDSSPTAVARWLWDKIGKR